jgi:hypothetical protein
MFMQSQRLAPASRLVGLAIGAALLTGGIPEALGEPPAAPEARTVHETDCTPAWQAPAEPPATSLEDGFRDLLLDAGLTDPETGPKATGLLDNFSAFLGLDGSKGPEDLGINANFGFRAAANWGYPLLDTWGLGVQLGTAVNYSSTAVRVLRLVTGNTDRTQSFTTVGLFQRSALGLNWGVGYDFLLEDYYENLHFGQWRGQVGYQVGANDEFGVWGTLRDRGDSATVADFDLHLRPISQANLFWRRIWTNELVTRMWVGVAEGHGRFLLVAPGESPVHHPVVFGADVYVPLNDHLALFGEANFITPNDSGTVTATFGFAFYPAASARTAGRSRFAPLLPLANNPTFALDLRQ